MAATSTEEIPGNWRWVDTPEEAVKVMEQEQGPLRVLPQSVKIRFIHQISGLGVHEALITYVTSEDKKERRTQETYPVTWLKRWGVIKRLDSTKKAETFLNSNVGKTWLGYFLQECKGVSA